LVGPTAIDTLLKLPILRGWGGNPDAEDWLTVGTGRKLEAIKSQKEKERISASSRDIEEEWKGWTALLSEEFINYVRTTKFIRFRCPSCQSFI
jgi:hypothetical protein